MKTSAYSTDPASRFELEARRKRQAAIVCELCITYLIPILYMGKFCLTVTGLGRACVLAGTIAGWYTLKFIKTRYLLLFGIFGLFFILLKLTVAAAIGTIALPARTLYNLFLLWQLRK